MNHFEDCKPLVYIFLISSLISFITLVNIPREYKRIHSSTILLIKTFVISFLLLYAFHILTTDQKSIMIANSFHGKPDF